MSAPEAAAGGAPLRLGRCEPAILEVAWLAAAAPGVWVPGLEGAVAPGFGQVHHTPRGLCLCVRPARWLLLSQDAVPLAAGAEAAAARVDLSSALATFILAGEAIPELLSRGCRLDLDPAVFAVGCAAATIMAQVAVTLAVLPAGVLLLTPASTAQHFQEWLEAAAGPCGLTRLTHVPFTDVCGERSL